MCYTKTLPFKFIGVVLWLLNSQWKMHHCDVPSSFFLVLSQIEEYKKPWNPAVFRRAWGLKYTQRGDFKGGIPPLLEGAQPLATFWNLCGFARKWHSCTRWGPNSVVYSHGHHQVFVSVSRPEWTPKFAQKSQGRSNLASSDNGSGQLSGYDTHTLTHQLIQGCWFTVSILHAVEMCTRNRQFRAGLIYGKIIQQLKG